MAMTRDTGTTIEGRIERKVSITRLFDAPRELVFRSFTEAEHIAAWWGPEGFAAPSASPTRAPAEAPHRDARARRC